MPQLIEMDSTVQLNNDLKILLRLPTLTGSKLRPSPLPAGEGTRNVRKPFSLGRRVGMRANLAAHRVR
jgi:hypothetical protein